MSPAGGRVRGRPRKHWRWLPWTIASQILPPSEPPLRWRSGRRRCTTLSHGDGGFIEHSIHLFADASRLLPGTDPDGRQLIISCGATLHHLRVSLSALGWNSAVNRLPDRSDPRHLAAIELNPAESSADAVALAALITRRRSDRRPCRCNATAAVRRHAGPLGLPPVGRQLIKRLLPSDVGAVQTVPA